MSKPDGVFRRPLGSDTQEGTMQEIKDVIEARYASLAAGDVPGELAHFTADASRFTLAPPLAETGDPHDPLPHEQWLAGFAAPPQVSVTRLEIVADGDVAFATSIDRMTATPKGEDRPFTLWYRSTLGLRRVDGRWLIAHEHTSVPFHMGTTDGTFRAATDLTP
jgi:ketosteroid isomerase-like protein